MYIALFYRDLLPNFGACVRMWKTLMKIYGFSNLPDRLPQRAMKHLVDDRWQLKYKRNYGVMRNFSLFVPFVDA
jgi:hypothetical protein